jgi:hypothetical protein
LEQQLVRDPSLVQYYTHVKLSSTLILMFLNWCGEILIKEHMQTKNTQVTIVNKQIPVYYTQIKEEN